MHPAIHPTLRSDTNLRNEIRYERGKKTSPEANAPAVLGSTPGRRRQYSDQQKLAMVMEAAEPDVTVSMVARRYHVTPPMIFRWRAQFGLDTSPKEHPILATARVVETRSRGRPKQQSAALILPNLLPQPPNTVAVELADGRRVFAPADSDPADVRRYIAQQESAL
jgi:transposase-like protein